VCRVGVVDDAVLERERAQPWPLAAERLPIRSHVRGRDLVESLAVLARRRPVVVGAEVVLDGSGVPLLLAVRDVEVGVEIAVEGRRPWEAPAHPLLVRLQLRQRSPRHRGERDVVIGEVDDGAVEAVRDRRAGRASCRVVGPEHEVVDQELRASSEQLGERRRALVGLEPVLLVDTYPRQFLALLCQLVSASGQRLLGLEQLEAGREPLFTCSGFVVGHSVSPFCGCNMGGAAHIGAVNPGTDEGATTIRTPSATIASATGASMAAFAGRSFCARPMTVIAIIQATLITL